MYTLAAICFMIYTTELNYAHADDEDLGSASSSLDASVTVGTACNFSGNVDIPHTSTIMNGVNSTDIGKTTLNVTCNDQGGYAVYAIGYTNDEYGNTSLKSSISDDYNISTGTSTSGNTSNWSMKLATVPGTTTATIDNNYNNYHTVPDDYTKVATLNTITDPGTSTTGSSISTTYQAYISPTQPAGTYSGKVKYTLVHPSIAPKPETPVTIDNLQYMQDFATLSENQKTNVLDSMPVGQQYTLKDNRDQKDYYVSKLADGNVWMTQNLDLCIGCQGVAGLYSGNTDLNQAGSGAYVNGYTTRSDGTISWNPTWGATTYEHSIDGTSVTNWSDSNTTPFSAESYYVYVYTSESTSKDTIYNSLEQCTNDGHTANDCAHYHVGNYYNWTAAIASNDSSSITSQYDVAQNSICPAGWRLPKGQSSSTPSASTYEFGQLFYRSNVISDLTSTTYTSRGFQYLRKAPLYFTRGGSTYTCKASTSLSGLAISAKYWSSTASSVSAFNDSINPASSSGKSSGASVRCLVK